MYTTPDVTAEHEIDDGVVLQQRDDVCFVQIADRPVDAEKTRQLGEKLLAFIERAGCRKLVMSFEGMDCIYGFLQEPPSHSRYSMHPATGPVSRSHALAAGSDLWVG